MIKVNDNFHELADMYLFSEVGKRVRNFRDSHPTTDVVRMDIGDVTLPMFPSVAEEMTRAIADMRSSATFKGYGPEQGYGFMRELISEYDYRRRGIEIDADDIFVSDGAKSDLANLGDIFPDDLFVALPNPSYPVYVDDNVIQGRAGRCIRGRWSRLVYMDINEGNGFVPDTPAVAPDIIIPDIIIMCYPNNPTGECITRDRLEAWVEFARRQGCLIIYDSAYEAYVRTPDCVRSIYEIPGAEEVAIEVRSYSKTAGFTGLRCGYTVVPEKLRGRYSDGRSVSVKQLWLRRQTTMFNGVSYVTQRGAAALYTEQGQKDISSAVDYYLGNAGLIKEKFIEAGFSAYGGVDSPYVWVKGHSVKDSWEMFDSCLEHGHFSTTPGIGFGPGGEGYIRLTGFNSRENTEKAMAGLKGIPL